MLSGILKKERKINVKPLDFDGFEREAKISSLRKI